MAKTFADMTPEERAECVGMWALIEDINGPCIITGVVESGAARFTCPSEVERPYYGEPLDPSIVLTGLAVPDIVTSLTDLPRAWEANGEPVTGKWEERQDWTSFRPEGTVYHWARRFITRREARP